MGKILILNTGGTFNKVYNELLGYLEVSKNSNAIEKIVTVAYRQNIDITIKGVLFKDSLELNDNDRATMIKEMEDFQKVIIVHGTDTMNITASYLSFNVTDKIIVLTGAMKPFSIEPIESSSNLSLALQFLQDDRKAGVYIGMHGLVCEHHLLKKNKKIGKFEIV